jgi:opacity protein-like surface antigen
MIQRLEQLTDLRLGLVVAAAVAAISAFTFGAGAAAAGDVSTARWTGFYIGAGAGMGQLNMELSATPGPAVTEPEAQGASASLDGLGADGGFLSISAGADYQLHERFVIGVFADVDFHNLQTDVDVSIPGLGVEAHGGLDVDRGWSVGGRLGYLPSATTMLFVSGGYTRLGIAEADVTVTGPFPAVAARATVPALSGAFVGAGFETFLTSNISLRGEYRYNHFGDGDVTLPVIDGLDLNGIVSVEASPALHTERLSLVYRF